jgi:release factor glutamine methyltransferase
VTISGILTSAAAFLAGVGVETPRLDATLLLAHILRTTRSALLAHDGETVNAVECAAYGEAIGRRATGESVAVITGHKEFRYLDFIVSRDTLIPRPETETLVEAALEKIAIKGAASVLDLGTGSGAAGLSIKHEAPTALVTLSDISDAALNIARKNSEKHRLAVTIVRSDLFANITGTFDIIVSNPPYVPSDEITLLKKEVQNEPRLALDGGKDGLELIRRILRKTQVHLNDGGSLMMEADPRQMAPITEMLLEHRYWHITVLKDMAGNDRIITATRP